MKRYLFLAVAFLAAAGAFGCGSDAPKAEPKFKEPPKASLGEVDTKSGPQQTTGGEKPKK